MIAKGGVNGSFSRLERSELSLSEFCSAFEEECKKEGQSVKAKDFIINLDQKLAAPNALMVQTIKVEMGYVVI